MGKLSESLSIKDDLSHNHGNESNSGICNCLKHGKGTDKTDKPVFYDINHNRE